MKSFKQRYVMPLGGAVVLGAVVSIFVSPYVGALVLVVAVLGLAYLLAATDTKLLDQMTQANSALVEQSMAASAGLRSQAHELSTLISRFVLPGQGAETALPPIGQIAHAHRQQALLANG